MVQQNMISQTKQLADALAWVKEQAKSAKIELPIPTTALILGSGLGGLAAKIEPILSFKFAEIPHFPQSTAPSHAGRMIIGKLAGQLVICSQGRLHTYEGNTPEQTVFPLRLMHALGAKRLVVTNAAGAINESYRIGDIMLISDQINFTGTSPLTFDAQTDAGELKFDMTYAYTPALRELAKSAAETNGIASSGCTLREGVYLGLRGPSFETPAEIRAFRVLGADAVGMSTVHEVIFASALGMEILGLSLMTNMAAGIEDKTLSTEEVTDVGEKRAELFTALVERILSEL
jgi:purine-nucleoside phosphorylase